MKIVCEHITFSVYIKLQLDTIKNEKKRLFFIKRLHLINHAQGTANEQLTFQNVSFILIFCHCQ